MSWKSLTAWFSRLLLQIFTSDLNVCAHFLTFSLRQTQTCQRVIGLHQTSHSNGQTAIMKILKMCWQVKHPSALNKWTLLTEKQWNCRHKKYLDIVFNVVSLQGIRRSICYCSSYILHKKHSMHLYSLIFLSVFAQIVSVSCCNRPPHPHSPLRATVYMFSPRGLTCYCWI